MWVPPKVSQEIAEESRAYQAELVSEIEVLDHWTKALKRVDPYLEMVRASESATALGVKPGYYHVLRHNPGAPPEIFPIEGPAGEFREPDSGVFDALERSDMWNDRAMKARQKRDLDALRQKERAKEREEEERLDEITERWGAANRLQVQI